jgi:chromosome segregation ATPase
MDKKTRKKIDALQQRLQKLRQQLAGAKRQRDDLHETASLEREVADAEAQLARLKRG